MTTQALYNKWRGQTFDDILGQEHITTTLQNQIRAGRIGHAYLFTGLRGTGKTSLARIMAKAVNCIGETDHPPCNRCAICRSITEGRSLDLIEIDAASNRGIDEIRDLRDKVAFSPSEGRYKVYVVDEVHMLTNEAFNALLKTLEEPPPHVIFILCTTEPHRLPDTVLSRCQRFDFRRGSVAVVLEKLRRICAAEGIAIAPDALEFIARRAGGSFRDAESLLEQMAAYSAGEITLEQVQKILGSVPTELIERLVLSLVTGDVPTGLRVINQAMDGGAEPRQFLAEILDHLRALLLTLVGGPAEVTGLSAEFLAELRQLAQRQAVPVERLVRAIKLFNEAGNGLRTALRPTLPLELALVEAALRDAQEPAPQPAPAGREPQVVPPKAEAVAPAPTQIAPQPTEAASSQSPVEAAVPWPEEASATPEMGAPEPARADEEERPAAEGGPSAPFTLDWVKGHWQQVLVRIKSHSPQVQALLNSTEPVAVKGDSIILACDFKFHRDRLSEDKNRDLVERVLGQVLGMPCHIQCEVRTEGRAPEGEGKPPAPARDLFQAEGPGEDWQQKLLEHPAVQELKRRGGRVTKVSLRREQQEEQRGK